MKTRVVFGLVLILNVLFAFNVAEYLYKNETTKDLTFEDFTFNGSEYSIVFIKGIPTFLLKDGELINDSETIANVLLEYYKQQYYPTSEELNLVREYIKEINKSRNDGEGVFAFYGKEENYCRKAIGENLQLPPNYEDMYGDKYMFYATIITVNFGDEIGINEPGLLYDPIKEFFENSDRINELMEKLFEETQRFTPETIYGILKDVNTSLEEIRKREKVLEESKLRYPLGGKSECSDCYAICPPVKYNETAINELSSLLERLLSKTKPLGEYKTVASTIYNNTLLRLQYKSITDKQRYYLKIYGKINKSLEDIINRSEYSLLHVMNSTLAAKVDRLKALRDEVEEKIAKKDFEGIDEKIKAIKNLMAVINSSVDANIKYYEETEKVRDKVSGEIFLLQSKDLEEEELNQLSAIQTEKSNLDASFVKGLSPEEYMELKERYENLSARLQPLIKSKENVVIMKVKAFAKDFGETTSDMILAVYPLTTTQRSQILEYLPKGLAIFVFLVILSLIVYLSSILYVRLKGRVKNKNYTTYYWIGVGGVVILTLLFTIGFYILLDRSILHASFEDFNAVLKNQREIAVVVDYAGAPQSAASPMMECAKKIVKNLAEKNKTVTLYTLTTTCSINGVETNKRRDECIDEIQTARIVLAYSNIEKPPSFSTIMDVRAFIYGDEQYYELCPLAVVLGGENG